MKPKTNNHLAVTILEYGFTVQDIHAWCDFLRQIHLRAFVQPINQ
jgi:hypothetical protein